MGFSNLNIKESIIFFFLFFFLFPPFIFSFTLFLGPDHHNSVNLSLWQGACYLMSNLQDLFLQVVNDVITFWSEKKISSLFPEDSALSFPVTFFEESKLRIMQINFICVHNTLGVLLGLILGPCWKKFYE